MTPPTQGTWRSNDYVSAVRWWMLDSILLWSGWWSCSYTHIRWSTQTCATTLAITSPSHSHHILNITFPDYLRSNIFPRQNDSQLKSEANLMLALWLHLPRAPGVVMTTSVLLGWWMLVCSMEWVGGLLYTYWVVDTKVRDHACHHIPTSHSHQHPIYIRRDTGNSF